jgi:hypothetical protein
VTAARRDPPRRVTAELLAFHKNNARPLRLAACHDARRGLLGWLAKLLRRR